MDFFIPLERRAARAALVLPASQKVVLVSGGGWGVGDLEGAVESILSLQGTVAVCLAGRNAQAKAQLEERFADEPRVVILGFTRRMNELMAASDVVIHATGGLTYLEAMVRSRPVIAYRPPPGHPAIIAATLAEQGRQYVAKTQAELVISLTEVFSRPQKPAATASARPTAAATIVSAAPRVHSLPPWRQWGPRVASVLLLTLLLAGWMYTSERPYPVLAHTLHLRSADVGPQSRDSVALIICADPSLVPDILADLGRHDDRASFVFPPGWSEDTAEAIRESGNRVVPGLGRSALRPWALSIPTLRNEAERLGLVGSIVYLPEEGLNLHEYVIARRMGAVPMKSAQTVDSRHPRLQRTPVPGGTLVVRLNSGRLASLGLLDAALTSIHDAGLRCAPLDLQDHARRVVA